MHPILHRALKAYRPLYLHGLLRDGQYPLPWTGVRWHGVPRRVVARQESGLPNTSRPCEDRSSSTRSAALT